MENTTRHVSSLAAPSKDLARRLLTMGENRLELLIVEVQEERERLLHAILLALGVVLFALLAGLTLTAALVVMLWTLSPAGVLFTLTVLHGAAAVFLYRRFTVLQQGWKTFPATLEQLKKDRAGLESCLT